MQIENNSCNSSPLEQANRAAESQQSGSSTKTTGGQSSTSQTDGLQLSSFAGSLSKVLQSDSTSRSQKVAQLTAAVQSGNYQVDPLSLSQAMINHAIAGGSSLP